MKIISRVSYTADSIEALTTALNRLPDMLSMRLGESDRANLICVLRATEDLDLCSMRNWAEYLRARLDDGPIFLWPRVDVVNLIALLYIVAWNGHKLGFREYHCDWSRDFYSTILDTLNVELV